MWYVRVLSIEIHCRGSSESAKVVAPSSSSSSCLEFGIHLEKVPDLSYFPALGLPICPSLLELLACLRPVRVIDAMAAKRAVLRCMRRGGRAAWNSECLYCDGRRPLRLPCRSRGPGSICGTRPTYTSLKGNSEGEQTVTFFSPLHIRATVNIIISK